MSKVLFVNTSASQLGANPTGVWLEELACPYFAFTAAGFTVAMASPEGGASPIDAASMGEGFFTDDTKKFLHDATAMGMFCHQAKIDAKMAEDYDCVYLTGGHGTCVDFHDNATLKALVEAFYAAGKVVAADCHGPIGLAQCNKPDGTPLVKGMTVTGFSDVEEDQVQLTAAVPFLVEKKFVELGANFEKADPWNSKVCVDGKLITGQNPQSSEACAAAVIAALK